LLKLEKQHVQTQLSALRSQVNPHFLFNSLNVIYALSLDDKDQVQNAVVELSDILRYVIYDSNKDRVSLKDEIELLRNYIAFQKHRLDNTPTQFVVDIEDENFEIYPMLLLPLLENAYKYGVSSEKQIEIKIFEKDNGFNFSILNNKVNMENTLNEGYSGFGLKHLKKNLEIVYQGQHNFKITDQEDYFKVELSLYKS
jgi:sensor histidine kinase YesM